MVELQFPGALAPAPPGLRMDLPGTWVAAPAETSLVRAVGPAGEDGARSRVSVDHLVLAPDAGVEAAMQAAIDLRARGGLEVDSPFVVDLGGLTFHGVNLSWVDDGRRTYRVHLVAELEGPDPVEVSRFLVLTGEVSGEQAARDYDQVQTVLSSVVLEATEATEAAS